MSFKFDLESIDRLPRLTEEQSWRLVRRYEQDAKCEERSGFRLVIPLAEEYNDDGRQLINGLQ